MSGRDSKNPNEVREEKSPSRSGTMKAQNKENIEYEIERNKKRIESLTNELKESSRSKETRIESLEVKIKALENEIRDLKQKNKMLVQQLEEMANDNDTLNVRVKKLEKENEDQNARIKSLEKEKEDQKAREDDKESLFTIVQIGTALQRNMCKYVLREHFKERYFYKFKDIDEYIENVEQTDDQESARQRLRELKKKIRWNQQLVDSLKNLNQARIKIVHPKLSSEKIEKAMDYLTEKGELDKELADNIHTLKDMWETSEALLETSTEERQDHGSPRNLSNTGQDQDTYPSKTAGSHYINTKISCLG